MTKTRRKIDAALNPWRRCGNRRLWPTLPSSTGFIQAKSTAGRSNCWRAQRTPSTAGLGGTLKPIEIEQKLETAFGMSLILLDITK